MKTLDSLRIYIDMINLSHELDNSDGPGLEFNNLTPIQISGLCEGITNFCQDTQQEFDNPELFHSKIDFLLEVVEELKEYHSIKF